MNYIGQIIEALQRFVIWWVQIMPWEEAVHVRAGKTVRIVKAGIHLRLPIIDRVYVQSTRLRVIQCPPQTVTTRDGQTVTIVMNLGYQIFDIRKLYDTLLHADQTLANLLLGAVARFVKDRDYAEIDTTDMARVTMKEIDYKKYGVRLEYVQTTTFCKVRAYRLLQEGHWLPDELSTNQQKP